MARLSERLDENVPGEFFVDSTCIDCGICRWVAPVSFSRAAGNGLSYVHHQPADRADRKRALMALVACPTASIGTDPQTDASEAVAAFPERFTAGDGRGSGATGADLDVSFCGFASPDSYGAASWLIRREGGNVLVDSPRAAAPLLRRIEELG